MSDTSKEPSTTPPPLPMPVIGYQSAGDDNQAQKVFDTVVNLRMKDNLIQLACLGGGLVLGAGIGALVGMPRNTAFGAVVGAFGGLVLSLLLSGFVIGLIRLISTTRKK
jgi:predicted lipid-binding transport protein (Tim44 family)